MAGERDNKSDTESQTPLTIANVTFNTIKRNQSTVPTVPSSSLGNVAKDNAAGVGSALLLLGGDLNEKSFHSSSSSTGKGITKGKKKSSRRGRKVAKRSCIRCRKKKEKCVFLPGQTKCERCKKASVDFGEDIPCILHVDGRTRSGKRKKATQNDHESSLAALLHLKAAAQHSQQSQQPLFSSSRSNAPLWHTSHPGVVQSNEQVSMFDVMPDEKVPSAMSGFPSVKTLQEAKNEAVESMLQKVLETISMNKQVSLSSKAKLNRKGSFSRVLKALGHVDIQKSGEKKSSLSLESSLQEEKFTTTDTVIKGEVIPSSATAILENLSSKKSQKNPFLPVYFTHKAHAQNAVMNRLRASLSEQFSPQNSSLFSSQQKHRIAIGIDSMAKRRDLLETVAILSEIICDVQAENTTQDYSLVLDLLRKCAIQLEALGTATYKRNRCEVLETFPKETQILSKKMCRRKNEPTQRSLNLDLVSSASLSNAKQQEIEHLNANNSISKDQKIKKKKGRRKISSSACKRCREKKEKCVFPPGASMCERCAKAKKRGKLIGKCERHYDQRRKEARKRRRNLESIIGTSLETAIKRNKQRKNSYSISDLEAAQIMGNFATIASSVTSVPSPQSQKIQPTTMGMPPANKIDRAKYADGGVGLTVGAGVGIMPEANMMVQI
eukprot:g1719.t1